MSDPHPDPDSLKMFSTRLPSTLIKDLKIKAVLDDKAVQDIVQDALNPVLYPEAPEGDK